jgi:2-polyprenyl-3-methyl-5-hydroxy-6-metoxy-1,4-benzoquinol methylase
LFEDGPWLLRTMQHYRPYICPFHELLPFVPAESTVLDVGCGSGLFLGLLHHFNFRIQGFGFDASRVAIECARRMAQRHGNGCLRFDHVHKDDSWPAGQFDVVSILDVLHHIPVDHQESAFRTAASAVRPGGLLVYKDISNAPWYCAGANRLHDLIVAREWIHYVPIASVEEWAAALRFEQQSAGSFRMLWYQHDLRVFRRPVMP